MCSKSVINHLPSFHKPSRKCETPKMKSTLTFTGLFLGFLSLVAQVQSKATGQEGQDAKPRALNKHEKLIVFSFDGFRYDYLDKAPTPNLKELRTNGVSTRYLLPAFTTKTFVNHQTFVTGLYPESHGVTDNSLFDPLFGNLTGFGDYNDEFWNFNDDVVPIWTLNEWAGDGRISGVQFPGANQHYGANRTLPTHFLVYNHTLPYEDRMDYVISWLTNDTHPANLIFMYFDEPDSAGHANGPDSPEVVEQISRMDNMTKYLVDKLKQNELFDQVNLIFWSDHGMQEVNLGNRINLTALVGNDIIGMYDRYGGSPVLQIQPRPGNEIAVYETFKQASLGQHFRVYNRSETPYRWHYQHNRRIPDILVVADPGFVFDDYRSGDNSTDYSKKYGVHGYDNDALTMRPFFIAHGPRFKTGHESVEFDTVDLFPLIGSLMGFGTTSKNGSFDKVRGLLVEGEDHNSAEFSTIISRNIIAIGFVLAFGVSSLL